MISHIANFLFLSDNSESKLYLNQLFPPDDLLCHQTVLYSLDWTNPFLHHQTVLQYSMLYEYNVFFLYYFFHSFRWWIWSIISAWTPYNDKILILVFFYANYRCIRWSKKLTFRKKYFSGKNLIFQVVLPLADKWVFH